MNYAYSIVYFSIFFVGLVLADNLPASAAERPNVVWLISEDNSIHYMKMFDENGTETPRIAELAQHGLQFNNAFSNAPVCSVARTTLMTSCYGPRIGTQFHRRSVTVPMPENVRMFPAYLRDAGYYTTNNQKKDYNAVESEGTWDESSTKATWRNRKDDQPFFHMQSFGTTHESSLHFSQSKYENEKTLTDPDSVFVQPYFPQTDLFKYTVAKYHDNMRKVDSQIGAVVDQLKQDGLLEDTFIFYFGDHGGVLPRGKGYAYESGLHVPLVVHVPENFKQLAAWSAGAKVDGFVEFIDFGATTLKLAGVEIPDGVDGKAFLGAGIEGDEVEGRNEAFGYADRFDEKYDLVRTLRKGKYEYVRNYQPFNFDGLQNNYRYIMLAYREWRDLFREGKLNKAQSQFFETRPVEQLFDIEADPHEINDLSADPAYAAVLADMRKRLTEKVKSLPDLSLFPESYLVDFAFSNPSAFGQSHRAEIARLVDIADLSLQPLKRAKAELSKALDSEFAVERYWGLIVCSCFGEEAKDFEAKAKQLLEDSDLLVRTRAAEFLGIAGLDDPRPTIMKCLAESEQGVLTNLILNSAVLLRDGKPGYKFEITPEQIHENAREFQDVRRRLSYFAAKDGVPVNPRGVKKNRKKK